MLSYKVVSFGAERRLLNRLHSIFYPNFEGGHTYGKKV